MNIYMKGARPFSQVFLRDKKYIKKILDSLDIEGEEVLEIGAGCGELSGFLYPRAKFLYCVEVDAKFIPSLKSKFCDIPNTQVIKSDILKFSLSKLNPVRSKSPEIIVASKAATSIGVKKKLIIFGNIPYQISKRIIKYLVENRSHIKRAYLTCQKEFSQKLIASVSTEHYGFLTCFIQYYAKVENLFDIPSSAFYPVPKVDSSFVKIEFYRDSPYNKVRNVDYLFKIVRQAFSQRRKKIINSLSLLKDGDKFLSSLGISPNVRAENLSLKEYISLANKNPT
ncbi:MAG: ribosomal RNA small subunit methyltransferase A [Candidatus Omnitrophica bacterium]|nr:ribosomal RNA small subunit methyltransferase A [Candidatus Omnitrophota bacterium]